MFREYPSGSVLPIVSFCCYFIHVVVLLQVLNSKPKLKTLRLTIAFMTLIGRSDGCVFGLLPMD